MWAGLNNTIAFRTWCISCLLSIIGFVNFSVQILNHIRYDLHETKEEYALIPYELFLLSAMLYMPFASKKLVVPTLLVLLVTAISSILLVYVSVVIFFGWNYTSFLLVFLAIHCLLFDFVYWGYTWSQSVYEMNKEEKLRNTLALSLIQSDLDVLD